MTLRELPATVVSQVFGAVIAELMEAGRVRIDGFGDFELFRQAPREARNPRTGDRITVPTRTVVRFKPAAALQECAEAQGKNQIRGA